MPSVPVTLSHEDVTVLGHFNSYYMRHLNYSGQDRLHEDTQAAIHAALAELPDGVMPRLGLCSWKGTTLVHDPLQDFGAVMTHLTQDDLRIGRALAASAVAGEGAVLHLRKWVEIPPWSEFRIFLREGRVTGLSQYHHRDSYPQIIQNIDAINRALFEFAAEIRPFLDLQTVVVDVYVNSDSAGEVSAQDITLIELNPFGQGTDACLFSWFDPAGFDGRPRYRK